MTPIERWFKLDYVHHLKNVLYRGSVWQIFIELNLSEMRRGKFHLVEDMSEGWFQIYQLRG